MDRRDFLLRAGLMSAALTSATTAPAGFEQQGPGRRVGRHGQVTLANDALLWQLEWRERRLRSSNPPVIVRIEEGNVILDFRTILQSEEDKLVQIVHGML